MDDIGYTCKHVIYHKPWFWVHELVSGFEFTWQPVQNVGSIHFGNITVG